MLVRGKEDIYCPMQLHVGVCERENLSATQVIEYERKEITTTCVGVGEKDLPNAIACQCERENRFSATCN
jgi:hypothetical protein